MKLSSLLILIIFCATACTCPNRFIPLDDPPPSPICLMPENIRLALVLGGGGAKGMAHVGVLEVFEEEGIPIDLIVGCSAGSIVGALYAETLDVRKVKCLLENLKAKSVLDVNLWTARFGLAQGARMQRVLNKQLCSRYFEELKIPFILVATDLYTGELVSIGGGPLIPAIQASCAVPFIYVPVQVGGRVLVDGGVANPVPASVAKDLGADVVVAVDLGYLLNKTFPNHLFGVATRCAEISLLWQCEMCANQADVVIRPEFGECGMFEDGRSNDVYQAGRRAAKEAIPMIRELLEQASHDEEAKAYMAVGKVSE